MDFNKAEYKIAKDQIVRLIKDSHDWENTEGFIADGVICPEIYEKQRVRILCILAESYGYGESGMWDIETQLRGDLLGLGNSDVKTPRHLATLLWLLQRSAETGAKFTWEEWVEQKLPDLSVSEANLAVLQEALSKVAWINVKKASNSTGTRLDYDEVLAHARRNKEILREQIQVIAPHLVLVCGEAAFRSLVELGLLGPETTVGKKWEAQGAAGSPRVIEISHPSYLGDWGGYEQIYKTFERVYAHLPRCGEQLG
jgi:hypothetical protein